MPDYQQCLFISVEEEKPPDGEQATGVTMSCKSGPSSSVHVLKFFSLLPRVYLVRHPNVRRLLQSNNVTIVDETNVNRIFGDGCLSYAMEVLLDDSPLDSVNPLEVLAPNPYRNMLGYMLGDNIRVRHERRGIDRVQSVLEDSTSALIKRVARRRPEMQFVFFRDNFGSLLHLAATRGQVKLALLLIQSGVDVNNSMAHNSCTPLHLALAHSPGFKMTQFLIEHGADVNARDFNNLLPLHRGTEVPFLPGQVSITDSRPAIKTLLDYGSPLGPSKWFPDQQEFVNFFKKLKPEFVKYFCERFFFQEQSIQKDRVFDMFVEVFRERSYFTRDEIAFNIFCDHLQKITTLEKHLNSNANCKLIFRLCAATGRYDLPIRMSAGECEAEITLLKSRPLGKTNVSLLGLLGKNTEEVAILVRNKSVDKIAKSHELSAQFPIYGNILEYHLAKGAFRKSFQEAGIASCRLFFKHFEDLPDELQERIFGNLSVQDILSVKIAAHCPRTST